MIGPGSWKLSGNILSLSLVPLWQWWLSIEVWIWSHLPVRLVSVPISFRLYIQLICWLSGTLPDGISFFLFQ